MFFRTQYISGFCYALNMNSLSFYAIGGIEHNYRRKLSDEERRLAEARDSLPTYAR
jgi:hypothetical protein